jgi:polyisoprenoid-binding protein YceI
VGAHGKQVERRPALAGTWVLDEARSEAAFRVRHLGVATQRGRFDRVEGTIRIDARTLHVRGSVQCASVRTGDEQRDGALLSADLFDAERHPRISFTCDCAAPTAGETLEIEGELTIRGLSRPLRLSTTWELRGDGTAAGARLEARARGALRRSDYGLRFPGPGGDALVGETVKIAIEICALRSARGD